MTPRPWSRDIPAGAWDDVVIGSGMGGMVAAALLSKIGRRVLVLEQHYEPGGFTHTFKRPGYRWDVGVHAVGEVTHKSLTGRLLRALTDDTLRWASLGDVYDTFLFPDGVRLDFPDNPLAFRENLVAAFPREAAAIDGYFAQVKDISAGMKAYYLARTLPPSVGRFDGLLAAKAQRALELNTQQVVNGLTSDERLRTVLTAQWGYYGSKPSRSSFAMQALVVKHFSWGGYYPEGGSQQIARTLLQTVANAGGATAIAQDVREILVEGGRAVGVRLAKGGEVRGARVISAAGIASTVQRLLPEPLRSQAWVSDVQALSPASAHVCLYLGFKGDIRRAGAGSANQWFYETWKSDDDAWQVSVDGPLGDAPVLYCSFPSLKDPLHDAGPEQRHTGEVVTFVPWRVFEPWREQRWMKRGADYESFKARLKERLLAQLFRHLPGLESMLDVAELSTPVTTDWFVRPMQGSIYGLEPTPARFRNRWLRPRSPIPGLFFAGSDVATVGVIGAMMGGVLAALSAEPLAVGRYLKNMGMR